MIVIYVINNNYDRMFNVKTNKIFICTASFVYANSESAGLTKSWSPFYTDKHTCAQSHYT